MGNLRRSLPEDVQTIIDISAAAQLAHDAPGIVGTWELVSRTDRDTAGRILSEASLGAVPIGYLMYDAAGHVAAQLVARDRTGVECEPLRQSPDSNNNANIAGYSAYFGRYDIDARTGIVRHTLTGALAPGDVGKRLWRHFTIAGDTLTIWFDPLGADGTPRRRTLVWHRTSK